MACCTRIYGGRNVWVVLRGMWKPEDSALEPPGTFAHFKGFDMIRY